VLIFTTFEGVILITGSKASITLILIILGDPQEHHPLQDLSFIKVVISIKASQSLHT
jgi:hypothetical protein